jgi:3-methylcrotonyl-CoA carboxylase alpha subunit
MRKILIANRGEIARRIIRTAHRMGLETVAVYSDADAAAPHVREATEAVHIGPAPAAESYLQIDRLLAAAQRTGADAVHPGYGFLSENAEFSESARAAGLTMIGPPVSAIRVMGLKDAAKKAMKAAGVPVTPGYQGEDQSLPRLEKAAQAVGYPLLIKAVAGGGGKGMRRVDAREQFPEALLAAQREALRAFGNDSVMLEKLIQRPRHVEVQVFADTHGNIVHLFERDCSLQRRHQKVIEEAPAPGLSDRLRHVLGIAAITAAHAIGYEGAGTVEFIVDTDDIDADGDPRFYFMEMNTRLQVEHPVTEMITGLDLVEWQVRVARGERLPLDQAAIKVNGHAVEARLYAEDADNDFLPSTGTLSTLVLPAGQPGVRIDSGVEAGGEIGIHYDPMIGKVVAHGADRSVAIDRLVAALDACVIEGVKTNRPFLARLADHPAFRSGDVDTGFIPRHAADLAAATDVPDRILAIAALAVATERDPAPARTMFEQLGGFRLNLPMRRHVDLFAGERRVSVALKDGRIEGLATPMAATAQWRADGRFEIDFGGDIVRAVVLKREDAVEVRLNGRDYRIGLRAPAAAATSVSDGGVRAPMPGRVLALGIAVGQTVAAGDRLLVLEAMKMEHRLTAPVAGKVTAVSITEGDQVSEGALLVQIESEPA